MPNEQRDTTPDAAQVASEERAAAGAITLTEEETLRRLGAGGDEPDADEGSLSDETVDDNQPDRSHPDPTAQSDEDDAAEGSLSTDQDSADESESDDHQDDDSAETTDEATEATDPDDELDIGDIFLGIDDSDGGLSLSIQNADAQSTATDGTTGKPETPSLTNDERVQLWQGKYDQTAAKLTDAEKRLTTAETTIADLQAQLARTAHKPESFAKTPRDFIETGEEWNPEDRDDPSTPSGRAYRAYGDAYRQFEKDQLKAEIKAERLAEEAQRQQASEFAQSVKILRDKRNGKFTSDADVEELISWSQTVGVNGLYYLSLARDLASGKLPISRKAIAQIVANAKGKSAPSNGANKPVVKHKPAEPSTPAHTDSDSKILKKYFVDG